MSNVGIAQRAAKVSMVNGLSTLLSIAFQLVTVPICLKYWGQAEYGYWLALFASFMLLRSLDAGYVSYVGNKLNQLYHYDTKASHLHLSSALVGVAFIGSVQLMLAFGALYFDEFGEILGVPPDMASGNQDRLGLMLLMISWVLTGSYLGIVHRLLIPAGLMYQASWWAMGFQVSQFAAIMAGAVFQLGMLQTSILFAMAQFVIYLTSAVYVRQKLPGYYPWWQGARVSIGFKDLKQSMLLTASNLIQQGATNGVVLIVSALAGAAAVPAFTTVRTLTNLWTTVANVLTTPLLPDVVRFHAVNEGEKLLAVNQAYWVLVGSAVNCGVLLSYPLLVPLFAFWTGQALVLDKALLSLLLCGVVVSSMGGLMAMYLNGINSLRIVLALSLVRGVIVLGGGTLLYNYFDLAAFGISILLSEAVVFAVLARYFFQSAIFDRVANKSASAALPAFMGAGSVCLFLIGDGFEQVTGVWSWPLAMFIALAASIWGWKLLDGNIKNRLIEIQPFHKIN
jgi:O-antigen/teichoic acid export membrane protein